MIETRYPLVACALLGFILAEPTSAASMRCGSHIISDSGRNAPGQYEVLKKCGEPTVRTGNTWVYDNPGKIKRTIRFNSSGNVTAIN